MNICIVSYFSLNTQHQELCDTTLSGPSEQFQKDFENVYSFLFYVLSTEQDSGTEIA